MIAVVLEHIVVLVLDFPAGAAGGHKRAHRLFAQHVIGDPGILIQLLAGGLLDNRQFTPVHRQGIGPGAQGHSVDIAIGPAFRCAACPVPVAHLADGAQTTEQRDLLIQRRVGVGFAGEDEVLLLDSRNLLTEGLITVQIIAKIGHGMAAKAATMLGQPAFRGIAFAVLLLLTILRCDEFGFQGDHP